MISPDARLLRGKILGARIRKLRTQLRFSMKDAAALIGVSSSVLSSYETGKKAISLPELELLAFHFGLPLGAFLSDSESKDPEDRSLEPDKLIALRQRMIGARIRTRRNDLDLSLREVARDIEIPASRLSDYERGNKPIPLPELEAIVMRLDQQVSDYIDHHGPVADRLDLLNQVKAFRSLPEEMRTFLLDPDNLPLLRLAHNLSSLPVDDMETLGEGLLKLTRS